MTGGSKDFTKKALKTSYCSSHDETSRSKLIEHGRQNLIRNFWFMDMLV
jgi:hypothetical protein